MCAAIFTEFSSRANEAWSHLGPVEQGVLKGLGGNAKDRVVTGLTQTAAATKAFFSPDHNPIVHNIVSAATKTYDFLFTRGNWKRLVAFIIAWGIIFGGMGLLYGFKMIAVPLATGMGVGVGVGFLTGILTVKIFTSDKSLWDMINDGFHKLDPNGTRAVVVSVVVTVVLAAAAVFPIAVGVIGGVLSGNHITTKVGAGKNLGPDPTKIENLEQHVSRLEKEWRLEKETSSTKIGNLEQRVLCLESERSNGQNNTSDNDPIE